MVDDWADGDDAARSGPREPNGGLLCDIEAEQYVLAAMMMHPSAIEESTERLDPDHFYRPSHQVLYRSIVAMYAAGEHVDPVTLRAWVQADGNWRSLGGEADGSMYLAKLFALPANPQSAGYYARIIHGWAVRRAMMEISEKIRCDAMNAAIAPEQTLAHAELELRRAVLGGRKLTRTYNADEFLDLEFPGSDFVVPGLLGRQERVVVVGGEGAGKTMMSHQLAYATAAGVHPFALRRTPIPPMRVLILDFENPEPLLQRRLARLRDVAASYPGWDPSRLILHAQPRGADLTDSRAVYALWQVIKDSAPDLIVAGPVYKLVGDLGEDQRLLGHRKVAAFFDQVRSRANCCVWLETHAPYGGGRDGKRELRPEGSNIWAKWPEFGLSLTRGSRRAGPNGLEIGQYRGHREEGRTWPSFLTRNMSWGSGGWPWTSNWDTPPAFDPPEDE